MTYLRILRAQIRASLLVASQYRFDFVVDGLVEIAWAVSAIVPLFVVYGLRTSIGGYSLSDALVVSGFFAMLQAMLEGLINPSLMAIVEHVRKGTLDFVLLKPKDTQFLVSTAKFAPFRMTNLLTAGVLFAVAFSRMGTLPSLGAVAIAAVLFVCSVVILYAIWMLTACAAFFVVKVDNLSHLFQAVLDVARWPRTVFRGVLAFVFTFVLPFSLMTSFPAEALRGDLPASAVLGTIAGAALACFIARRAWIFSVRHYASASS